MPQLPHVTVATIVQRQQRFLLVREHSDGRIVYNQPAGHLEIGESLAQAAERETLEETGWQVRLTHFLGIYQHTSADGISYVRHCFIAEALNQTSETIPDPGIVDCCWLSAKEIRQLRDPELRSPMVRHCLADFLAGIRYPLAVTGGSTS